MKDQVNKVANLGIPGVSLSVIDEEDMKGVEKKNLDQTNTSSKVYKFFCKIFWL